METPTINPPGDGKGQVRKPSVRTPSETSAPEPSAKKTPESADPELLGADGRSIPVSKGSTETEEALGLGQRVSGYAQRNPTQAALVSLGIGLVLGGLIGALLAKD